MPPAPAARLNDYAGLLSAADRDRIEAQLAARERATGAQLFIAIFPSLEGESLEDFSIKLAERWRAGQKGLNNGVILVVFARDRKLRFEVGYGLEPVVPDIVAGQIIRDVIAPRFREGNYAAGLSAAIDAVYGRIEGKPAPPPSSKRRENQLPIVGFAVVALIIVFILGSEMFRSRRFVGGHGYTGGRGGWVPPIIFFPGGGGGWRGGGGGGGGDGGGFSGGGGGGFGGGGASGDW